MDNNQKKTPYLDALKKYLYEGISPFDVPGHHMGNAKNRLKDFLGKKVFEADVNAPIGMDNLAHPHGVLLKAEELMAEATGAKHAFFLINGTSSGIIAMIMTVCKANDKIILPRNVHKSITSALILSGACPIYVMPQLDMQLEIANQPSVEDYKKAIRKHPSAKAVFVINPTYFGAITDLEEIVSYAHSKNMAVLVDEAHGAHYYFSGEKKGPKSAMECGADISSVSFHKTGGSLTQSSVLLLNGDIVNKYDLQKSLNMINTTSPSSILLASLDAARQYMATHGVESISKTVRMSEYAFSRIRLIPGFIPRGKKYFLSKGCFNYDKTKLVIELDHINLSGFEVYKLLKNKYHIQMELAETYVLLGIMAIGTKKKHIDNLANALQDISRIHYKKDIVYPDHHFSVSFPPSIIRPRAAFHAPAKKVKIEDSLYEISKESIMIYPPGIPMVVPGEIITQSIILRLQNYKKTGVTILSDYDDGTINVINKQTWKRFPVYEKKLEEIVNTIESNKGPNN